MRPQTTADNDLIQMAGAKYPQNFPWPKEARCVVDRSGFTCVVNALTRARTYIAAAPGGGAA